MVMSKSDYTDKFRSGSSASMKCDFSRIAASVCAKVLRCGTSPVRRVVTTICLIAATVPPHYALAQDAVPVETTLVAEVMENVELPDGRQSKRLAPAQVIAQGDVVYYTVQIRNPSAQPARNVVVVQRIPANTVYVANSASGPAANITFSIDGGHRFDVPRALKVEAPTGTRAATPEDYTHIRWQLRHVLAPGAVAFARFQAVFK